MQIRLNESIAELISIYENNVVGSAIKIYLEQQLKKELVIEINNETELSVALRKEKEKALAIKKEIARMNATSAGKKEPNYDLIKLTNIELVYVILLFIPIINIKLSDESTDLAIYQFFGNDAGRYLTGIRPIKKQILQIAPELSPQALKATLDLLESYAPTREVNKDQSKIIVGNGIYDKTNKTLLPFNPKYVFVSKIQTNYNPNARLENIHNDDDGTDWDIETWLKDIAGANAGEFDPDTYQLFWQIIAASINPGNVNNKAIFFYSEAGNNGKGTFGQLLKNIVGKSNYSSLPINAFKHEFHKERLIGKTLNIADENPVEQYIDDVVDFKASITGDDILINRKHEKPIALQVKAVNIQMINGLPKTKDKSNSFYRRILLVPFKVSFTGNGERAYIKYDYINRDSVKEYVLKKALEMPDFKEFIVPEKSVAAMDDYKEFNDSVIEFWNYAESRMIWEIIPYKFLFEFYKNWYAFVYSNNQHVSYKRFRSQLQSHLENNPNWEYRENKEHGTPYNVGDAMKADEPLITKYNIESYMLKGYTGSDDKSRRNFRRPQTAYGLKRIKTESDTNS